MLPSTCYLKEEYITTAYETLNKRQSKSLPNLKELSLSVTLRLESTSSLSIKDKMEIAPIYDIMNQITFIDEDDDDP